MQNTLMAKTAETTMAVNNLYALPDTDISEDGKEGKDSGKSGGTVDDKEGDVVDFDAVGKVSDTFAIVVGVGDDDDLVTAIDEFRGNLVYVGFYTTWLRKEEVADHGDVVRLACHIGGDGKYSVMTRDSAGCCLLSWVAVSL